MTAAYPDELPRFSFAGLPPGTYRITVQNSVELNAWLVSQDLSSLFEVEVSGGSATEVDLAAPAARR